MKYAILVLALSAQSSFAAKKCDVKAAVLQKAEKAAGAYAGKHDGYTVEINDPDFEEPEYVKTVNGAEKWKVDMRYNDTCYGSVTLNVKPNTCTIMGKAKINEGECTDE
jgi:hypothetical protein